jgi:aminoglycoside 6'-N-acetyltransferase
MTGATRDAQGEVAFRPVLMADVPMLTRWLGEPHVRRFYQKAPITRDEVAAEYSPMIRGETPDIVHLALTDGAPFGYIQCYRNADYPDWADVIDVRDGISVDFFVGEPRCLGQGFGRLLLGGFLQRIAFLHFAAETQATTAHEPANTAALRCSQSVGFRFVREFLEDGAPMLLHAMERDRICDWRCDSCG